MSMCTHNESCVDGQIRESITCGSCEFIITFNQSNSTYLSHNFFLSHLSVDKLPGAPLNGWVPDKKLPCYGLPGAIAPFGFFDPLGFTKDMELGEVKRFREAEVMHGRVAMMAVLGYIIGESTPTIAYGMDTHHTIANNQLAEVAGTGIYFWTVVFPSTLRYVIGQSTPTIGVSTTTTAYGMDVQQTIANNQLPEIAGTGNVFWFAIFPLFLAINFAESWRANTGWVKPG